MTIEQPVGQGVVKIRTSRYVLIQQFAMAGFPILLAISTRTGDPLGPAPFWTLGSVIVAMSLWSLTWGVDLMPESANLRWTRRRNIPWQEV